jgi:hypothetical protein
LFRDVRERFQSFLKDGLLNYLFKLWEYIEDFQFSHPENTVSNYQSLASSKSSSMRPTSSKKNTTTITARSSQASKLQLKADYDVNSYALCIYHFTLKIMKENKNLFPSLVIQEIYERFQTLVSLPPPPSSPSSPITTKDSLISSPRTTKSIKLIKMVPGNIFESLSKTVWGLIEKLFYEPFLHHGRTDEAQEAPDFRKLVLSLQHAGRHIHVKPLYSRIFFIMKFLKIFSF